MIIYRIYEIVQEYEWSPYNDDMMPIDTDKTIKYVDSKEKVNIFFQEIEKKNKENEKCYHCPIIALTKRKYNNHRSEVDCYCNEKDLFFNGNNVFCNNYRNLDLSEYRYEEIEVQ